MCAQCRQLQSNWSVVSDCLSEIQKNSVLSGEANEALQRAKQCVRESLSLHYKLQILSGDGKFFYELIVCGFHGVANLA